MSIINQMLKDLENRSSKSSRTPPPQDPAVAKAVSRERRAVRAFVLLFLLAAILLGIDLYVILAHRIHASSRPAVVTPVRAPVVQSSGLSSAMSQESGEATLGGITAEVHDSVTRLRFLLNRPVLYRINTDTTARTCLIVLDHVRLAAEVPLINYAETGLESMKLTPAPNGGLEILLHLREGARLQQAGIFPAGKPELQVSLVYHSPTPPQNALLPSPPVLTQPATKSSFAEQSLQTARQFVSQGEIEHAISLLKSVTAISPEFHPAREMLVRLLMQHGRSEEAESVLHIGLVRYPDWIPYVDLQARWLSDQGQTAAALQLLSQHSPSLMSHPDYYALMAALYQRQNQPQMAAPLYQQLIAFNPHNARWWLGYAIALDGQGRHSEAVSAYVRASEEQGVALNPELKAWVETRLHPM